MDSTGRSVARDEAPVELFSLPLRFAVWGVGAAIGAGLDWSILQLWIANVTLL